MNSPLISIFMPAYNAGRFLAQALDSLLSQTFRDVEIIVVNDGSDDNTPEVANAYASKDGRIRIVSHERNKGLSAARNSGWAHVSPRSRFIMNHDSDDISLAHKLERLVQFLQANPDVAAVGSFCRYINEQGEQLGYPPMEWTSKNIRHTFGEVNSVAISAALVRRTVYEAIAPFRVEFGGCDDYDFWARALTAGFELANLPQVLHHIRVHRSSMGATHTAEMAALAAVIGDRYNQLNEVRPHSVKRMLLARTRIARFRLALLRSAGGGNS